MNRVVRRGFLMLTALALAALLATVSFADTHDGESTNEGAGAVGDQNGGIDVAPMLFAEDYSPAHGHSVLTRDGERGTLSVTVHAANLTPGNTYTYWWVVFNRPQNCDGDCEEDDLFVDPEDPGAGFREDQIENVGIVALGGNGEIAGDGGTATFTGTLYEGSALPHDVIIGRGGMMVDYDGLLEDVMAAEVHIVLRDHGPAKSGDALAEQLWTFGGSCVGVDPEGDYECQEPQFAVHQ